MELKTCCFTGHRVIPAATREELTAILDRRLAALADVGFTDFRTGGARGFDTLAAERVLHLCETRPECQLHLILPCEDQHKRWNAAERAEYERIKARAHSVRTLFQSYTPECMHLRNRALVDGSDLCLCYLLHNSGGTLYTCTYALKRGVRVINLADELTAKE